MDIAAVAVLIAPIVYKAFELVKYIRAKEWNGVSSLAVVFVIGIACVFLLSATSFANGIDVGERSLSTLGWADLLWIGLTFGATSSVLYDFKKSFDNSDTASQPALLSGVRELPPVELPELGSTTVQSLNADPPPVTVPHDAITDAEGSPGSKDNARQPVDYTTGGPASSSS